MKARSLDFTLLLLLVVVWQQQTCLSNPILIAKTVITAALNAYQSYKSAEGATDDQADPGARLHYEVTGLSREIQDLKDTLLNKLRSDFQDKLAARTDEMFQQVDVINTKYERLMSMYRNSDRHDPEHVKTFANEILSPMNSKVDSKVAKLYRALVLKDISEDNVLTILLRKDSEPNIVCKRGTSAQILMHDLYKLVVTTDTRGLLMQLCSWDLKRKFENKLEKHVEYEKKMLMKDYNRTVETIFDIVLKAMSKAPRHILKCDPPSHERGENYFKFAGVLQTYFLQQADTVNHMWSALWTDCEEYVDERLICRSHPCLSQPTSRRCTGHLRDCKFVSHNLQLCHSPEGSDRRYDWVMTEFGTSSPIPYGHKNGFCKVQPTQGVHSSVSLGIGRVNICACTCESEDQLVDRYVSLHPELSDMEENKVVTGVRFVKKNHVLHLQVQQGTLGPEGNITDQPAWKNVTEITDNELLSGNVSVGHRDYKSGQKWVDFTNDNDLVYSITYRKNTVLLDDIIVDPGYVVTGLKFGESKGNLYLAVHQAPFDYATGQLDTTLPAWRSWKSRSRVPISERDQVDLGSPDESTRTANSDAYSHGGANGKFVNFQMTSLVSDVGQNVVPYVDLREVTTDPPMPLDGVSIYHRGKKNFGGFIAPKIIHYDFTKHFERNEVKPRLDFEPEDILYW